MFNDEEQDVTPETVTEEVEVEAETEEVEADDEPTPEITVDWEKEAKRLQAELGRTQREVKKVARKTAPSTSLDVEDYIGISTALDGLDQREKARLAEEHKLSGKPLKAIRESEDFQLWQTAYRQKQEKENALKPSSTQAAEDMPKSAAQKLRGATSLAETEAILRELGLYKDARPRADKVDIGARRSL